MGYAAVHVTTFFPTSPGRPSSHGAIYLLRTLLFPAHADRFPRPFAGTGICLGALPAYW